MIPGLTHHLMTTTAVIERRAPVPIGRQFNWQGTLFEIERAHGEDPAAPVILRQTHDTKHALAGQLALYGLACVEVMMTDEKATAGLTDPFSVSAPARGGTGG